MSTAAVAGRYDHMRPHPGSVEITAKRGDSNKVFQNPNGTCTWVGGLADQPIHYRDAKEQYQEIDPTIRENSGQQGFAYAMTENTFEAYFTGELTTGSLAKFKVGDSWVRYSVADPFNHAAARTDGTSITYANAFPEADIRYTTREGFVKQEIILHRYTGKSEFRFRLEMRGMTAKLAEDGSVRFYGSDGSQKWYMPCP